MQKPSIDIVLRLRSAMATRDFNSEKARNLANEAANAILDLRYELARARTALKAAETQTFHSPLGDTDS